MSKKLSASLGPVFAIVNTETNEVEKRVIGNTQNITIHSADKNGNAIDKYFDRNATSTYINTLESERAAAKEYGYLSDFDKKVAKIEEANAKYNAKLAGKGLERRLIGFANAVSSGE